MLDIDWITDLHNPSPVILGKDMSPAEQIDYKNTVLSGARAWAARQHALSRPDFIINTGDNIDTTHDIAEDARLQFEVQEIFQPFERILHTIPGNHDVRYAGLANRFNFLSRAHIYRHPQATIILWYANVTPQRQPDGHVKYACDESDRKALVRMLNTSHPEKPVILFTHIPLGDDSCHNPIDEHERINPWRACYANHALLTKILGAAQRRIFVFSGHRHVNHQASMPGAPVELFYMDRLTRWEAMGPKRPAGSNDARITVTDKNITVRRRGVMPAEYTFRL